MLADLVFAAAQNAETVDLYDGGIDRARYFQRLRAYDGHSDPPERAAFIPVFLALIPQAGQARAPC